MYKFNGKEIRIDVDLVVGEGDEAITHPAANLQSASFRAELGIIDLPAPKREDDRFYWNGDIKTPKDLAELQAQMVSQIKTTAASMLAPTSWYVERSIDPSSGKPVPDDVLAFRALVRTAGAENEAAILAVEDVPALEKFVAVWPKVEL